MTHKLNFYTSYHQFYISDRDSFQDTGDINFWTKQAYHDRLATGDGILGVGLECYGPVEGEIILLAKKVSTIDFNKYDHIVEAGIEVKSGFLQVLDCPNFKVEFELKVFPGTYRVRIYSLNLSSVVGDSGNDFYKVEIWPDTDKVRTVVKQYNGSKRNEQ